jgi:hypothetical protein
LVFFPELFFELGIGFLFCRSSQPSCNDVIVVARLNSTIRSATAGAHRPTILSIARLVFRSTGSHAPLGTKISFARARFGCGTPGTFARGTSG